MDHLLFWRLALKKGSLEFWIILVKSKNLMSVEINVLESDREVVHSLLPLATTANGRNITYIPEILLSPPLSIQELLFPSGQEVLFWQSQQIHRRNLLWKKLFLNDLYRYCLWLKITLCRTSLVNSPLLNKWNLFVYRNIKEKQNKNCGMDSLRYNRTQKAKTHKKSLFTKIRKKNNKRGNVICFSLLN